MIHAVRLSLSLLIISFVFKEAGFWTALFALLVFVRFEVDDYARKQAWLIYENVYLKPTAKEKDDGNDDETNRTP